MSLLHRDEGVLALLLIVGSYFPTSIGGEYNVLFYQLSLLLAVGILSYLNWKHGMRPGAGKYVVFPMVIILTGSTFSILLTHAFPIGWGTLVEFSLLALVLSLDLRSISPGPLMRSAFVVVNVLNIGCGIAILAGNEWIGTFLPTFYAYFYPELVPNMISLHKPVLTFGTHSVAGFFLYLFFWLNWETYKLRRSALSLLFAISWLVLLAALASATSLGLAALASAQVFFWLWKYNRRLFAAGMLCILLFVGLAGRWLKDYVDISESAEVATALLSSDISGPFARYGPGGSERGRIEYLVNHPLSPIGFASPVFAATVDSAPLEYLLRGSVPFLLLIYFGVYRFLRHNLASRSHARILFLVIIAFETGFTVLTYFRTFYLLPLVVVYLNQLAGVTSVNRSLDVPQLGT